MALINDLGIKYFTAKLQKHNIKNEYDLDILNR